MDEQLQRLRLQVMATQQAAQIGARMRAERDRQGLSRRQVAEKMEGIATAPDLYRWEKGRHRPRDPTLATWAEALGKDYAWAMGSTPDGDAPELLDVLSDDGTPQLDRIEHTLTELVERLVASGVLAAVAKDTETETPPAPAKRRPKAA